MSRFKLDDNFDQDFEFMHDILNSVYVCLNYDCYKGIYSINFEIHTCDYRYVILETEVNGFNAMLEKAYQFFKLYNLNTNISTNQYFDNYVCFESFYNLDSGESNMYLQTTIEHQLANIRFYICEL